MRSRRRTAAITAAVLVIASLVAGAVAAVTRSPDETALARTRGAPDKGIERKVDRLLAKMTLEEKLQQLVLLSDGQVTDEDARNGVGAVFSLTDPAKIHHLQQVAMTESRLKIPILFAYDTIHGYRTIFPIPLGAASSFDPSVVTAGDTIAARETATVGIKQTYAPMVDVSHEPRWGRIAEAGGEDPYLGSAFAAAKVKAFQGSDYSKPDKVIASPKHAAAYGQPEGGRDYNTTDMSEARLRNLYLPPFRAAIDAGADTVDVLVQRDQRRARLREPPHRDGHHEGRVGVRRLHRERLHRRRRAPRLPARQARRGPLRPRRRRRRPQRRRPRINAGTDSEMVSTNLRDYGAQLVRSGQIPMSRINDAVRRVLRVKFRAGLFAHPFVDQAKAVDPASFVTAADRAAARSAASRSMVLLKNDGILPLDPNKSIAVIGPLGDDQHDMLGPWWGKGEDADAVSLLTGLRGQAANVTFTPGCTLEDKDPPDNTPAGECGSDAGFAAAVAAAQQADQVVLALGETRGMSGEAAARSVIDLPGRQQELIDAIKATGKPFVVVLFNGRPLTLGAVDAASPAILEAWFPGVEAGNAVADVLFGKVNPGGKLPVTFPRALGQVPIYYNHEPTGRPCDATSKYNSRYRDIPTCDPLYPFGYGLSYTTFRSRTCR